MATEPATLNTRIDIEGTYNSRDIDGYPAGDCLTRSGVVYRSDAFHRLTTPGTEAMKQQGIRRLVDLRPGDEIDRSPNAVDGVETLQIPIFSGFVDSMAGPDVTLGGLYEFILEESAEALVRAVQAARYELTEPQRQIVSESPAPVMLATLETLDERWGSAEGYLLHHGLPSSMVVALRTRMLDDATCGPQR